MIASKKVGGVEWQPGIGIKTNKKKERDKGKVSWLSANLELSIYQKKKAPLI